MFAGPETKTPTLLPGTGKVLTGLFRFEDVDCLSLPTALANRLDYQQQQVLMSICAEDASPLQVVQAYAGTGKTHLAMCLVRKRLERNQLDDTSGTIIWAVRTRTLRDDIMHSLVSSGVV